jgi:hypothetical protein
MGDIDSIQRGLMRESFLNTMTMMKTNFQNVMVALWLPMVKVLTPIVATIADVFAKVADFFTNHPTVALFTSLGIVAGGLALGIGAVALAVRTALPLLRAVSAIVGDVVPFTRFTASLGRLGPMLSALANPVGLAIGAVVGLFAAFRAMPDIIGAVSRWWGSSRGHILYTIGFGLGEVTRALIAGVGAMVQSVVAFITSVIPTNLAAVGSALTNPTLWVAQASQNYGINQAMHGARGGSGDTANLLQYFTAGLRARTYSDRDVSRIHAAHSSLPTQANTNTNSIVYNQHVTVTNPTSPHEVRKMAGALIDVINSSSNFSKNAAGGSLNSPFMVPGFARPQ